DSSERFGMSRVISSSPSLVERASISYSWMWIEERTSSLTSRSEITIASSKLKPSQGMNATSRLAPRASSPRSVELRSARDRLALHVRAHQRAVRVVVLEERNQRRPDRDDLRGRDVHEVDVLRPRGDRLALAGAAEHLVVEEAPGLLVHRGARLGDRVLRLL